MPKPEISIPAGLATAALVYSIYSRGLPPLADIRTVPAQNPDVAAQRKQNAWLAAGVVSGISLIAKDPTIFILGGLMVVALDFTTRHANAVHPEFGKVAERLTRADVAMPTQDQAPDMYGPEYGGLQAV